MYEGGGEKGEVRLIDRGVGMNWRFESGRDYWMFGYN